MNKKKVVFIILIPCIAVLLVFSFLYISKQYKIQQAICLYDDFIDGSISVGSWDIIEISTPTGEPDKRYATDYAMVDVTGDGIPELHIKNGHEYIIFSVSKGQMCQYAYFQSYDIEYYPLENGAFLLRIRERYEYGDYYTYFGLDTSGEPVNELNFSWISKDNYTFDENDEYVFDGNPCTYEEWYDMTREYLYTDTTGTEQVRNAVEWISYCTSSAGSENIAVESASTDLEEDSRILSNDENGLILTDEVYLFEREFDPEARVGGKVEVHYPQIKGGASPEIDEQTNLILRDTAFSFFDFSEEKTYEEALDLIAEETKDYILDATIDYLVLQCNDAYLSLIFSVDSCNSARVYINQYLATIDLTTGQYIHFDDLMDMDELGQLLRNDLFEVYEGTSAFFKEEDAHEQEITGEFIKIIEKDLNSPDPNQWPNGDVMEHTAANPHYDRFSARNIGMDDQYLYIRFDDGKYYSLHGYFIFRIPLKYTNIEVPGSEFNQEESVSDQGISESKAEGQDIDIAAAYKLLNQDIFGEKAIEEWHTDSVNEEIYEFADLVKGSFETVPYEGDLFPSGLIEIMEAELYRLNEKDEISDSWYETLDALGADVFRLDLDEMYWLFPELYAYRDEIETEYDAYNRIFREQIAKDWVSNEKDVIYFDCEAMFLINMAPDEDYYVFTYTDGGSDRVRTIDVMRRTDGEFVEADSFEAQRGGGRIIQYDNDFYYVTLYANEILHCIDGIRVHKLGTDALKENILIRYLPEHYAWKNIYDNEDTEFGAKLEDYIDSIRSEITSDGCLGNGKESGTHGFYGGDEGSASEFSAKYGMIGFYQVDLANIGVPAYIKENFAFPPRVPWFDRAWFCLYDEEQDEILELENMKLGNYSSYPFDIEIQQIWFKKINGQVLTFSVYYLSDYNYVLDVLLVEGDKVTRIRSDVFVPDQSRFVLTEGRIFRTD